MARCIVAYASLAFVGLGADTGAPDWGAMAWEYRALLFEAPLLMLAPTLAVAALALACHLALDGSSRRGGERCRLGPAARAARRRATHAAGSDAPTSAIRDG